MMIIESIRNGIFGRKLPVVTYATEPEQIVKDVKVKSPMKLSLPSLKGRKFDLSHEGIPNLIIGVTVLGECALICAYISHVTPFIVLAVVVGVLVCLVQKYKSFDAEVSY